MIRFVPPKESFSGRWLARLGKLLGLRSETVYSRAILLTTMVFLLLGGLAVAGVWYLMVKQFNAADEREARASALAVREFLAARPAAVGGGPSPEDLRQIGVLLGREVYFLPSSGKDPSSQQDIRVSRAGGGIVEISVPFGPGKVVVSGPRPFQETGSDTARLVMVGLAVSGGLMLLLILFIVDRTILSRVQLLIDRVEKEKQSERLPVELDVPGDDEIAQLASSIEELARLLQAAEREYRNVVEDQTDSIVRFDENKRITFHNRSFSTLCRSTPEGKGALLQDTIDPETFETLIVRQSSQTPGDPVTSFTHPVRQDTGSTVWYRSTLRSNFDGDGRCIGGQWIAADVTNEAQAQRKLQDSQRQLQALSAQLLTLQDEERRRIARDLHDSTAQALSALEMNTTLLESTATGEKARKLASETAAISRQVCRELRNISYLLHPPLLEEEGLVFAIRWFAEGFTKRNNIPVFFDVPESFPRLGASKETALFRIVQEALSNIYRHAGASKAWITLQRDEDGAVTLEIRDNGEGLPEGFSFAKSAGVGLAGMRERLQQLGGTLEVESSPYGVSVKCRLSAADKAEELATDRRG